MTSYYERSNIVHLDGTHVFQTQEDRQNEQAVADLLNRAWECSLHPFGALCPIDWYAERNGRLVGVIDLKSRPHPSSRFPTVYLNVRKWLALTMGSLGLGCPALFVVKFTDGVFWANITSIDATRHNVAGCAKIVKSSNDIEPVIEVPVTILRRIPA